MKYKSWVFIPFTKAFIMRHAVGSRFKISITRIKNPFKITMIRIGRTVFYSNYEIVHFVLEQEEKNQQP